MAQKDRLDALGKRVEKINFRLSGVETRLGIEAKDDFDDSLWNRVKARWRSAVGNPATGILVAIVLCLVSVIGGGSFAYWLEHRNDAWNRAVDDRVDIVLSKKGGVNETLVDVQRTTTETNDTLKALQPFIHDVIVHAFDNIGGLSKQALTDRAPALGNLVTVAKQENVRVNPSVVSQTGARVVDIAADRPKSGTPP